MGEVGGQDAEDLVALFCHLEPPTAARASCGPAQRKPEIRLCPRSFPETPDSRWPSSGRRSIWAGQVGSGENDPSLRTPVHVQSPGRGQSPNRPNRIAGSAPRGVREVGGGKGTPPAYGVAERRVSWSRAGTPPGTRSWSVAVFRSLGITFPPRAEQTHLSEVEQDRKNPALESCSVVFLPDSKLTRSCIRNVGLNLLQMIA